MAKSKKAVAEEVVVETPVVEQTPVAVVEPVVVASAEPVAAPVVVAAEQVPGRRNEKIGVVVSTKMQKTIVVEIEMRKAHPKYKRVMKSNKKFYAHDEQNSARTGDVVRIREMRPLSKLKRWTLEEIVRRSTLSEPVVKKAVAAK